MASDKSVFLRPIVIDDDSKNVTVGGAALTLTTGTYPNVASVLYELQTKVVAGMSDVIVDGDCEAVGVADWTAEDATLSKEAASPHGGTKWLKILATAQAGAQIPQANQTCVTVGKSYLISGWAKSDGTQLPKVQNGSSLAWTGTTSTDWQAFSVVSTCAGFGTLYFYFTKTDPAGTEWVGFDDITVYNLTDGCPVDFVPTFTSDFKAKFDATTDFSVTWTDTNLRDMLGFTAAISGDNTYTATYTPQYSWFPARVRADNDEWYLDSKSQWKGSESRTGNVCGLRTGASIYRTTLQFEALPDYEAIRARALTAAQDVRSLEYFAAQSRECWGAIDAPSPSGFYFFPDYTAVLIQASASYTSGDVTTFHRTSSPGTFAFCQFDSDWHPKFKPTIRSSQSDWFDVDVDVHTATAPTWTGA